MIFFYQMGIRSVLSWRTASVVVLPPSQIPSLLQGGKSINSGIRPLTFFLWKARKGQVWGLHVTQRYLEDFCKEGGG